MLGGGCPLTPALSPGGGEGEDSVGAAPALTALWGEGEGFSSLPPPGGGRVGERGWLEPSIAISARSTGRSARARSVTSVPFGADTSPPVPESVRAGRFM